MNPESTAWSGVTGIDPFATPLRVVHVCALETAWAAEFVEHIADFQSRRGWNVQMFVPATVPPSLAEARPSQPSSSAETGPSTAGQDLADVIADVRPQAVVLHGPRAGVVGRTTIRASVPTIVLPHRLASTLDGSTTEQRTGRWTRLRSRRLERGLAPWTNALVALSEPEAASLRPGLAAPLFVSRESEPDRAYTFVSAVISRAHAFGHLYGPGGGAVD